MNFIKQKPFLATTKKIHSQMKCVWSNEDRPSFYLYSFFYYRGQYYWLNSHVVTGYSGDTW